MRLPDHVYPGRAFPVVLVGLLALALVSGFMWRDVRRLGAAVGRLEEVVDSLEIARSRDISLPVSPLLLHYQLDLPGRGEVFPAMAAAGAPEYWPVAVLRVTNTADRTVAQVVAAEIPGWSRRTEHSLLIGPREERQVNIQPELLPRAYRNQEIHRAVLEVRATGLDGATLHAESHEVLMHGGAEIYWGRKFANAQMAARWVTPHDREVLELVSKARRYASRGRLAGYSSATGDSTAIARHVRNQAKAVFRALKNSGLSYVSSLFVMGDYVGQAQRIRLPRETLHLKNANCMDVSVVFASTMENLGMEPLLVVLPGHALAGVRSGRNAGHALYLDLTVLPNGSFEAAIKRARDSMRKTPSERVLVVDVAAARVLGIYPLVNEYASPAWSSD